jgi:hypothetical protein
VVIALLSDVAETFEHSHGQSSVQFPTKNGVGRCVVENTSRSSSGSIRQRRPVCLPGFDDSLKPNFRNVFDHDDERVRMVSSVERAGVANRKKRIA